MNTLSLVIFYLILTFQFPAEAHENNSIILRTYGEATTLESERGTTSSLSTNFLKPILGRFSFYVGVHLEKYQPGSGGVERISPLVGLELPIGILRLFSEFRYANENPKTGFSNHDPRFGITGGYWVEESLSRPISIFSDSYFEYIGIPRVRWTPNGLAFSKAGFRLTLTRGIAIDPYVEAYAKASSDPALGRDAAESRAGLRIMAGGRGWSTQIATFRRFVTLIPAPDSRWRVLFAMGGEF